MYVFYILINGQTAWEIPLDVLHAESSPQPQDGPTFPTF
jgi:hypothetical protein